MDGTFEADVSDMMHVAHELQLQSESEETRQALVHHLLYTHDFMQQKQHQYEDAKKAEIVAVLEEIDELKDRISHLRSKEGSTSRDVDHEDYVTVYRDLKLTAWQDMFDALLADTDDNVKTILNRLNNIVVLCADRCQVEVSRVHNDALFAGLYPGEEPRKVGAPKVPTEIDDELAWYSTYLLHMSVPFCMESIQKSISKALLAEKKSSSVKLLHVTTPRLETALKTYLAKCIEFGWLSALEQPPVNIITDPKQQCKKLAPSFVAVEDVPFKMHVEWPALVQGGKIIVPWELYYHRGQPRPVAKQLQQVEYNTREVRANEEEENLDWELDVGMNDLKQVREEQGLFIEGECEDDAKSETLMPGMTLPRSNMALSSGYTTPAKMLRPVSAANFVGKEEQKTDVLQRYKYGKEKPKVQRKTKLSINF